MGFQYDNAHLNFVDPPTDDVIMPWETTHRMPAPDEQMYVRYGRHGACPGADIVIHARDTNKFGQAYRNWHPYKWNALVNAFPDATIASVGRVGGSMYVPGTTNMLDMPLAQLANFLANSRVIVGPSSGPMHFASLCGLPQVVWTGPHKNVKRYEEDWNPFRVKVKVIEPMPGSSTPNVPESWDAELDEIVEGVREMLDG